MEFTIGKKTGGRLCICVSDHKSAKKLNNSNIIMKISVCYSAATLPLICQYFDNNLTGIIHLSELYRSIEKMKTRRKPPKDLSEIITKRH
jgi:hypothetical protein